MIHQLQNWLSDPSHILHLTIGFQIVLLFGLWFQQFNFYSLIKILNNSNKTNADLIDLNRKINNNEKDAIEECKRLNRSNWELKRKIERYEDIYGPLNTES